MSYLKAFRLMPYGTSHYGFTAPSRSKGARYILIQPPSGWKYIIGTENRHSFNYNIRSDYFYQIGRNNEHS